MQATRLINLSDDKALSIGVSYTFSKIKWIESNGQIQTVLNTNRALIKEANQNISIWGAAATVNNTLYLNKNKFVDLNTIATQAILVTDGYSIKDLEKYYDFKRNSDIKKGTVSEEYYNKWIETGDKKFLDEIAIYNKEDCISTAEFHKWLIQKRDKNLLWFVSKIEEFKLDDDKGCFITGEPGTGKTYMCKGLQQEILNSHNAF